ncbi:MAG: hypothetical protein HC905_01595 [Bacteroidales bacterium]|nr:hypothetical protein [Bacteroidales bacterium]
MQFVQKLEYIGLHGKEGVKEKASVLASKIEKAISSGKIGTSDPYFNEIKEIQESLQEYLANKTQTPTVKESTLNGIATWLAKRQQKKKSSQIPSKNIRSGERFAGHRRKN